jgi:vancomycin resistance protein VanW
VASHNTPLIRPLLRLDEQLQLNKIVNLRIAAKLLDGIALEPGQRLSFWKLVGKPSYKRGFRDGLVLQQGRLSAGVGGGLCQMTNLLYWMTLHTPLTVVERWRHSYDVFPDVNRTQPFGSGATCSWPVLDLQIANYTTEVYRLSLDLDDSDLRGAWTASRPSEKSYLIQERSHLITHDGPSTYTRHNEIWRVETDLLTGEKNDEFMVSNEARLMYDPFLPQAKGD